VVLLFVVGAGQKEECPVDIMNDGPGEGRPNPSLH